MWNIDRRTFIALASLMGVVRPQPAFSGPQAAMGSLLAAPIELTGDWESAPPEAVGRVLSRVRQVCLFGLNLVSDQQPGKLRVENGNGLPAVWLHSDLPETAWIIVDVGPAAWSQLAYQFGHELGHVFCNSWKASAKPRPPTQWLEEAMVEAFSIRGLALLAVSWEENPVFGGDAAYAASVRDYRADYIQQKTKQAAQDPAASDMATWFRAHRNALESGQPAEGAPAVLGILTLLENDRTCVEDMGAANRWPARTGIPIEDYLIHWQRSCAEVGATGNLPGQLRSLFHLG